MPEAKLIRSLCAFSDDEQQATLQRAQDAAAQLSRKRDKNQAKADQRKPVWEDPDDDTKEVEIARRNRLRKLRENEDEMKVSGAVMPLILVQFFMGVISQDVAV